MFAYLNFLPPSYFTCDFFYLIVGWGKWQFFVGPSIRPFVVWLGSSWEQDGAIEMHPRLRFSSVPKPHLDLPWMHKNQGNFSSASAMKIQDLGSIHVPCLLLSVQFGMIEDGRTRNSAPIYKATRLDHSRIIFCLFFVQVNQSSTGHRIQHQDKKHLKGYY